MDKWLEEHVRRLADNRCEYCRIPSAAGRFRHVLDHVIARYHGGGSVLDNLALCCARCNEFKGSNIAGIDSIPGLCLGSITLAGIVGSNTFLPLRVRARKALMEAEEM